MQQEKKNSDEEYHPRHEVKCPNNDENSEKTDDDISTIMLNFNEKDTIYREEKVNEEKNCIQLLNVNQI